jgi:hypothetical protein
VRILLDEQLPRQLARELTGHVVRTVQSQGWAGLGNGELLERAAETGFEVFLTANQNLQYQKISRSPDWRLLFWWRVATRWKTWCHSLRLS